MVGSRNSPLACIWPPKQPVHEPPFFTRIPENDRDVIWPPENQVQKHSASEPHGSNMMLLRDQAPVHDTTRTVYASAAAVVQYCPVRQCADKFWPPANTSTTTTSDNHQQTKPERTHTPTRRKDFTVEVPSCTSSVHAYKPPPGTLHVTSDTGRYLSDVTQF